MDEQSFDDSIDNKLEQLLEQPEVGDDKDVATSALASVRTTSDAATEAEASGGNRQLAASTTSGPGAATLTSAAQRTDTRAWGLAAPGYGLHGDRNDGSIGGGAASSNAHDRGAALGELTALQLLPRDRHADARRGVLAWDAKVRLRT